MAEKNFCYLFDCLHCDISLLPPLWHCFLVSPLWYFWRCNIPLRYCFSMSPLWICDIFDSQLCSAIVLQYSDIPFVIFFCCLYCGIVSRCLRCDFVLFLIVNFHCDIAIFLHCNISLLPPLWHCFSVFPLWYFWRRNIPIFLLQYSFVASIAVLFLNVSIVNLWYFW